MRSGDAYGCCVPEERMKEAFAAMLERQVGKGVYVWGGNGELLPAMADPKDWIARRETSEKNAARAVALYQKRVQSGVAEIRAFDCSGLIYWAMKQAGARKGDLSAAGFFKACRAIRKDELVRGDLMFRRSAAGNVCHVGAYVGGGETVECYGRDVGVVKRKLADKWSDYGRYPAFDGEGEGALAAMAGSAGTESVAGGPSGGGIGAAASGSSGGSDGEAAAYAAGDLYLTSPPLRGEGVRELQRRLMLLGYDIGVSGADGVYGPRTAAAIELFKRRAALVGGGAVADLPLRALLGL